ncbi:MAG: 3-oxocholest-4-en-26-oate---CoA ligase [Actinomycetota bacterium]|nr:3-oxocholest-4-en-26-oate---CoA ligase [Actinomycetota bacterium]
MGTNWNLAAVWDVVAAAQPDAPALRHGETVVSWGAFQQRVASLAAGLRTRASLTTQGKVGLYLVNAPAYLEAFYASLLAGLVPVNTNFRYTGDELQHLWVDADVEVVVFHRRFTDTIEAIRPQLLDIGQWLCVDDGTGPAPSWATPYETAIQDGMDADPTVAPTSGDDLVLLYTGGTTGMPKGVMWRQDDLFGLLNASVLTPYPVEEGLDGIRRARLERGPGLTNVVACPLMHGTGGLAAVSTLLGGGCVVTLQQPGFDPVELLDIAAKQHADGIVIVGDTFAKPIAAALDDRPGHWDLSNLKLIRSSGTMWSEPVKTRLSRHLPNTQLVDSLGSSEALGLGSSVSGGAAAASTASFRLGANAVVLDDDNAPLLPGSETIGRLAVKGRCPVGYYKDPEKSARTFPVIDGVRYSVPGDLATVEVDGSIRLLGRGSAVINTGGEKVFAEEVEEVLKTYPGVTDAGVVGVPDDRFGNAVAAVVATSEPVDRDKLLAHVKTQLAAFKAPRHIVLTDDLGRAANAKLDHAALRALIEADLAGAPSP